MRTVSIEKLIQLQSQPGNIRNICILAHVDHGKTTLADSLVAANGIISSRMVGKLRYMDSRPDEQERGITMKSSAIALHHAFKDKEYLINLIDSPGHIDFCGEVSTATRMCDGALIIVDVVEGVCPQTHAVLRQAWREGIRPMLILNKIDRLITELKMTTAEAYRQMEKVLEEVNALAGGLFLSKLIDRDEEDGTQENGNLRQRRLTSGDDSKLNNEEEDDEDIYFTPESGNVVFASAMDGWGFRLENFVSLCAQKTGIDESSIRQGLWGDFYLDAKAKTIRKGAFDCGKKPLFVQMILDTVWTAYQAILIKKDKEMVEKIVKSLNIPKLPPSRQQDPKVHLQSVMSQWLPLADSVLSAVCQLLPSPDQIPDERVVELMCTGLDSRSRFDALNEDAKRLKKHIKKCVSDENVPVVVFVSKMFAAERNQLPENRRRMLTAEELRAMRMARQQEQAEKKVQFADGVETAIYNVEDAPASTNNGSAEQNGDEFTFMAFARVFCGTLRPNQRLYLVSGSGTNPDAEPPSICIDRLYMMMGRELEVIDQAPAGNVIAIGGLEEVIFKTATLSSVPECPPLAFLRFYAHPIVRVSVEPTHPVDMPKLVRALKLLNQTDPCVQTYVQDTGEHVLVTAGEVHLQRCLADLRERFSNIELNVSEPIIPFHETIVSPSAPTSGDSGSIEIKTSNKRMTFKIRARPLPQAVIDVMDRYELLLKNIEQLRDMQGEEFRSELKKAMEEWWEGAYDRLWSFGPMRARYNVLINGIPSYNNRPSFWNRPSANDLRDFDQSVVNGFQLRCQNGPLCDEPMRGVAFILEDWTVTGESTGESEGPKMDSYGPMSGQVIAVVKEGCKLAFHAQPQRLSMAMYSCLIQATSEVLGRVYGVLSRRGGRVLKEEVKEGTNLFEVEATLPVVESFGFADDIRTKTSGLASPQLVFSHWEVLDLDPFWIPSTEEELSHYGEKSDTENRALKYMNAVRRRKGLIVDEKTVEHAEKQRTLARKV